MFWSSLHEWFRCLKPKIHKIELLLAFLDLHHSNKEQHNIPYFPAHKTHRNFSLQILEKIKIMMMYFNFSNLLEENWIVTYQN
jgi:hypothetical protein